MNKFAFTLAAAMGVATAVSADTWDMPTPYGDATFHTVNIREFAADVAEATDGALEIEVHSAGSLFPHGEIKNAVRSGQVPLGEFFLSTLANEDLAFGMDSQPFLATSYEEAEKLWAAQKPVITELLGEQGLMPLFSVAWPAQGLYTNGEIATVDDLSGLRFRAYNPALEQFAALAKAAPVQVEAADIPQAFTTGQVEAMITSPSTGANSKAWDFVDTYTPINAWVPKNIVVVNQRTFDRLDETVQAAVLAAAAEAESRGWEMSKAEAEEKTAVMQENGMTIATPTPELVAGLQAIGEEMLAKWKEEAGEDALAILDAYQAE
ncbi:TRAP transporter substrate-binding protein [Celeribacter halophilus]|jgi:TRAP-type C4-dicarboxylate transport system substrate-binding protein|uniref:TRAP transporter substrate-binding protein n=2 Tax=Celeribacter halophilus TaxID=576117 RepID=A0AAW7XVI5_9RHOB|nr:TRAP transporter substrate-binding protein [Celeribacter halophilus]MBU2889360.1 TRAP transporter substrate-binding protein [Celeribacter halophilus]MDO6458060.1 TRAP transporter substrate-binding protein [Celeribacter halophilus]MDO6509402.1 TRAP transporter substrate-binding protein [Celeribacter halophilus]MDO6724685.1 TRAP transporter substrate-binding protein [Celeribacter halophilus]